MGNRSQAWTRKEAVLPSPEIDSAFYCACCESGDNLPIEEQEDDQRGNGNEQDIHEEQVVGGVELTLEIVESELHGYVFITRQII